MAQLEQRRSSILEDINGSRPLAEILEQITELVSFRLQGAQCWCEITDGARLGNPPTAPESLRFVSEIIPARAGAPLGTLFAGFAPGSMPADAEIAALTVGARLATLAIETRRLYSDLLRRSEFDLLTDIHNRFSLDKYLDLQIAEARQKAGIFGLIYIDLDKFKDINHYFGHSAGDQVLQPGHEFRGVERLIGAQRQRLHVLVVIMLQATMAVAVIVIMAGVLVVYEVIFLKTIKLK